MSQEPEGDGPPRRQGWGEWETTESSCEEICCFQTSGLYGVRGARNEWRILYKRDHGVVDNRVLPTPQEAMEIADRMSR